MKKFIFTSLLLAFVFPIFSCYHEYFVEVIDKGATFEIKMRTFENQNSICPLKLIKVNIEKPTAVQDGVIDLKVMKDPQGKCLMAIGPHRGSFTFRRGFSLPDGCYSLIINDNDYGFLEISEYGVYFNPINCL